MSRSSQWVESSRNQGTLNSTLTRWPLTSLALCCHHRASRVVGNDGRLSDNERDLCDLLVRQRDENLTLVDAPVRLLDVLDLQPIRTRLWHVCNMEALRNEQILYSTYTDPMNIVVLSEDSSRTRCA